MKSAIEVFGQWALNGGDERMARGHQAAVDHMLAFALSDRPEGFSAIDAGCGNGWVVRLLNALPQCGHALGIDGAAEMVARGKALDPEGQYVHADLMDWTPDSPVDLVHSMEVLYYFRDPGALVLHIADHWLKPGGRLIVGVDHYRENTPSLHWAEENGISFMTTLGEEEWRQLFREAGLVNVQSWRFNADDEWAGTLVLTGTAQFAENTG